MRKLCLLLAVCILAACAHDKEPDVVTFWDPPEYYVDPASYTSIDEDYDISKQSFERIRLYTNLGGFSCGPTYFVDVRHRRFVGGKDGYLVTAKMPPDWVIDGRKLISGSVKHYSAEITQNEFEDLRRAFDVLMLAPRPNERFQQIEALIIRIDSSGIDGAHARDQTERSQYFEYDAEFARHMFAVAEAHIPETAGWGDAFRTNAGLSEK